MVKTGLSFNTTYYCQARRTISCPGTYYSYSKDADNYTGTASVDGDVSAIFKFYSEQESTSKTQAGTSETISGTTPAQEKFTVSFEETNTYAYWSSTTAITDVPYGTAISKSGNKITIGSDSRTAYAKSSGGYTDAYTYSVSSISPSSGTITGDTVIKCTGSRSSKPYSASYNITVGYWYGSGQYRNYYKGTLSRSGNLKLNVHFE